MDWIIIIGAVFTIAICALFIYDGDLGDVFQALIALCGITFLLWVSIGMKNDYNDPEKQTIRIYKPTEFCVLINSDEIACFENDTLKKITTFSPSETLEWLVMDKSDFVIEQWHRPGLGMDSRGFKIIVQPQRGNIRYLTTAAPIEK